MHNAAHNSEHNAAHDSEHNAAHVSADNAHIADNLYNYWLTEKADF